MKEKKEIIEAFLLLFNTEKIEKLIKDEAARSNILNFERAIFPLWKKKSVANLGCFNVEGEGTVVLERVEEGLSLKYYGRDQNVFWWPFTEDLKDLKDSEGLIVWHTSPDYEKKLEILRRIYMRLC